MSDYEITNLELLKKMTEKLRKSPFSFESDITRLEADIKRVNSNEVFELKINNDSILFMKKGLIKLGSESLELLEEGDAVYLKSRSLPYTIVGITPSAVALVKVN